MSPERLTRQAIRAIQRKRRKAGRPLTREEALKLPVQTVDPWKRGGVIVMGLLFGFFAYTFHSFNGPQWLWMVFGFLSVVFVLWGALGKRGNIGREINKMPDDWPQRILDALINGAL